MHISIVLPPGHDVCAPVQLDGGLNTRFSQTDERDEVCGMELVKNELLKNERVSKQQYFEYNSGNATLVQRVFL